MTNAELLAPALQAVAPLVARAVARTVVGIAGPPAAGKSTLAAALTAAIRDTHGPEAAVAVPMDGFHLSNRELARLGLAHRKGAPETFDAGGFAALLGRLRAETDVIVYAPSFDHVQNESIGSDIPVFPATRLVVTDGNYLLLRTGEWATVRPLLDLVIYVDAPRNERVDLLLARQLSKGLDQAAAHDWVHRSDEANARVIAATRSEADLVLTRSAG